MAVVSTPGTTSFILSNNDWTDADLVLFAEAELAQGSKLSYLQKQLIYHQRIAGGGSSAWADITGRPDLSRTSLYTFAVGDAPALTNGATPSATFSNGSTFQSDLLIGAHLQIRVSNAGLAPQTGGYSYVPSTGTITTNSPVNDSNMFILAVFDIPGTGSGGDEPTEFSSEFSTEFF